jgi:LuxR family quorum sensing-dependent transcriptional regulator
MPDSYSHGILVEEPGRLAATAQTDFDIARSVAAISVAPDPEACVHLFRNAVAVFGMDTFACGEVDLEVAERTVFYALAWPEAFRKFYFETGVNRRDPLVEALRERCGPFTWSELQFDRKMTALGTKALQVLAAHGWTEGLVVPIARGDHRFGLVTMMGPRGGIDPNEKSLLAMLSYCFHERLRNLVPKHGFAVSPAGLTRREVDVLRLVARGATDRNVARSLRICPSTAHEHVENAKRKLRTSTRAEAVAVAVSLGIVAP